jgi:hypothetical protein
MPNLRVVCSTRRTITLYLSSNTFRVSSCPGVIASRTKSGRWNDPSARAERGAAERDLASACASASASGRNRSVSSARTVFTGHVCGLS